MISTKSFRYPLYVQIFSQPFFFLTDFGEMHEAIWKSVLLFNNVHAVGERSTACIVLGC